MTTFTAPYNAAMRLGSGFNSFTQELCINDAVVKDPNSPVASKSSAAERSIAQSVEYKTSIIDKATDVSSAMGINAAFLVKYDALKVSGDGTFANSNAIKESDVSFMVSVKVVNQVIFDYTLTQFQPITGLTSMSQAQLTDIYGDCFISGFQEGGEFTAVISIKVKDRRKTDEIVARAKVDFTNTKPPTAATEPAPATTTEEGGKEVQKPKKDLTVAVAGEFLKAGEDILHENEITITVSWSGGGQRVKRSSEDWTFETMRDAALKFPDLVAATPMRTHAILTKYTALRTFYSSQMISLPSYDKTGTYTNMLQEAYLDYKNIQKNIQVIAYDVSEGLKTLTNNPRYAKKPEEKRAVGSKAPASASESSKVLDDGSQSGDDAGEQPVIIPAAKISSGNGPAERKVVRYKPLTVDKPFEPTLEGLEEARSFVRYQMNRIIQEIDNLACDPSLAVREDYEPPYMSPFLFKRWLPISVKVPTMDSVAEQQAVAAKADMTDFATQFTGITGK